MSIIFLILKILGIILLIPVILLLILFICPICYRLEGEFDGENPKIKGRVSWALFFLRIKGWYEEQPGIIVRIFGLPVYRTDGKWAILGRNDKKKPVIVNEVSAPQNKEKKSQKDISEKIAHHISRETENSVQKSQSPVEDILDLPWDEEFEEELEFKLVGSTEANSLEHKISNESPVGQALLGRKVGETVEVETQAGVMTYKILDIQRVK